MNRTTALLTAALLAAPVWAQPQLDLSGPRVDADARAVAPAAAVDPAALAPADAAVFLRVDGLPGLHDQLKDDTLFKLTMRQLGRQPREAWLLIQAAMGMTGDELLRQYFGRTVALVVETPGDNQPGVVATAVDAAAFDLVRIRLDLQPLMDPIGDFQKYTTGDGRTLAAFGRGWMLVTGADHGRFLDRVLEHVQQRTPSLADDAAFKSLVGRLPAERDLVAFARDKAKGEMHALAATQHEGVTALHYAGRSPQLTQALARRGEAKDLSFGPLPTDAIAAMAVNLEMPEELQRPRARAMIDRLLAPDMNSAKLLAMVDSVSVMFLGETPGERLTPNPGLRVPAAGLAIKLKGDEAEQAAAAAALDKLMNNALLFANLATIEWQTDPIAMGAATHGPVSYRTADVGAVLAQRTQRPELAALRLAYGRVGAWYTLTTQDLFLQRMIDTAGGGAALNAPRAGDAPLLTATLDAQAAAAHVESWLSHWRAVRPQVVDPPAGAELSPEQLMARRLAKAAEVLRGYTKLTVTARAGADDTAEATLQLTR